MAEPTARPAGQPRPPTEPAPEPSASLPKGSRSPALPVLQSVSAGWRNGVRFDVTVKSPTAWSRMRLRRWQLTTVACPARRSPAQAACRSQPRQGSAWPCSAAPARSVRGGCRRDHGTRWLRMAHGVANECRPLRLFVDAIDDPTGSQTVAQLPAAVALGSADPAGRPSGSLPLVFPAWPTPAPLGPAAGGPGCARLPGPEHRTAGRSRVWSSG